MVKSKSVKRRLALQKRKKMHGRDVLGSITVPLFADSFGGGIQVALAVVERKMTEVPPISMRMDVLVALLGELGSLQRFTAAPIQYRR